MKYLVFLLTLSTTVSAHASGGYLWLNSLSHALHLPEHVVTFSLVCILLLVTGVVYRIKTSSFDSALVPDKGLTFRNFFEFIGEFIYNLTKSTMGAAQAKKYYKIIIMYFMLVFSNNLIGLVPGFLPPTENFNTTLALGLFVFLFYNWEGIKVQGLVGHIKHFMGPVWYLAPLMLILELISHSVRPISLGLRLKGNMQGDHMVLSIFSDLIPYIVPIPFYVIGIFVCFMQAFVFTLLTMVYIGLATETHDHEEHAH
jgi:F-type H+-transporting ATPase subunit a